ncbi:MAG TPA: ATP-binding protein [Candidatus Obscuribacter sp.]|nr:ATP-binding protein [Candidatus Obscuribacter sp.]
MAKEELKTGEVNAPQTPSCEHSLAGSIALRGVFFALVLSTLALLSSYWTVKNSFDAYESSRRAELAYRLQASAPSAATQGTLEIALDQNSPAETIASQKFTKEVKIGLTQIFLSLFLAYTAAFYFLSRSLRFRFAQAVLALDRLCRGHNELAFLQAHAGRYQDELSVLERELVRLSEILAAQDRGHRQWVADTSHELRTPIAVLRAQVEAFQDGVQEVTARNLEVLHNEIMALSKLVDDLHWLAKYDVGQIKVSPSLTDVGAVLQDVVEALCERFEGKGLKIENTTGGAGKILANLDINRLRPVFTNLMENSLRYTDRGGILKISAESDGKELSLRFDDSAPGVSDEVLGRMFERFFRAESSRNRTLGGSGLGLAICKNNMQMLGGTIEASHSPLGGVRIELKMPLNLPPDVTGTKVLDNSREATTNTVAAGSEVNQPDRVEGAVQDVRE